MPPQAPARSVTRTFRVSHARLATSTEYLEIVVDALAALDGGRVSRLNVEHSGACCDREAWTVTAERLTEAMAQRRHGPSVHVRLAAAP